MGTALFIWFIVALCVTLGFFIECAEFSRRETQLKKEDRALGVSPGLDAFSRAPGGAFAQRNPELFS